MANIALSPMALLSRFESAYRGDHKREHGLLLDAAGNFITQNTGDFDSVQFDDDDLQRAYGGFVTHTHPRGLPPSKDDLLLSARYNLLLRAVGNAPDTGQKYDYTVKIPGDLADAIAVHFDDEVERAEKQLSRLPMGDLQWQRQSRHAAISRMAKRYGFDYKRVQKNTSLSETTTHERVRLDVLAQVRPQLAKEVFAPLAADLQRMLVRSSSGGVVPITQLASVRTRLNALVQKTMLGTPLRSGALEPYSIQHRQVVPRSAYFAALYKLTYTAASLAVEHHASIMRKYLPPDLIRAFSYASVSPSELSESDEPQFDPLHLWLGPDGKRLSDRIWNATGDMRRKLDEYLTQAIARQLPVGQIAAELETYLVDGAGSYEALRLARTEVSAAHSRAGYLSALRNPFVEQYQPYTSPAHSDLDVCDEQEANGPYPVSDPTHLSPFHPNCGCGVRWLVVENVQNVVDKLRAQIENAISTARTAISDILNPLSHKFVDWLFRGRG
jgi:hypothetical protein